MLSAWFESLREHQDLENEPLRSVELPAKDVACESESVSITAFSASFIVGSVKVTKLF